MTFADTIRKLAEKQSLSRAEANEAVQQLMRGEATGVQIAAFLTALRLKGETVDEIAGAAEAMRAAAVPVRRDSKPILDTCGTGGDGQGSFNISTAAAFVVAGTGFLVAKHGNRSVSSRSGSADLLEVLGISLETTPALVESCLKEAGIAFLFAPAFHPATKHAMPVRRELGIRTIFNMLGPLTNPARPDVQLIGVFSEDWVRPMAEVLVALGSQEGVVVHGDGHDEIVLSGPTTVAEIVGGQVHMRTWQPADFGLAPHKAACLSGGAPDHNAKILMQVLEGQPGVYREAVCVNAAALIQAATRFTTKKPMTLKEAYKIATDSIDRRLALGKLEKLKDAMKDSGSIRDTV